MKQLLTPIQQLDQDTFVKGINPLYEILTVDLTLNRLYFFYYVLHEPAVPQLIITWDRNGDTYRNPQPFIQSFLNNYIWKHQTKS